MFNIFKKNKKEGNVSSRLLPILHIDNEGKLFYIIGNEATYLTINKLIDVFLDKPEFEFVNKGIKSKKLYRSDILDNVLKDEIKVEVFHNSINYLVKLSKTEISINNYMSNEGIKVEVYQDTDYVTKLNIMKRALEAIGGEILYYSYCKIKDIEV